MKTPGTFLFDFLMSFRDFAELSFFFHASVFVLRVFATLLLLKSVKFGRTEFSIPPSDSFFEIYRFVKVSRSDFRYVMGKR